MSSPASSCLNLSRTNLHSFSWSRRKKWAVTLVVSSYAFLSPLSSSMMAPTSDQIGKEFGITNNLVLALCTSVYVLAYGATYATCTGRHCVKLIPLSDHSYRPINACPGL